MTPGDDSDLARVPAIESPNHGATERSKGGTLYPPLLSDRTDSAERVRDFARLWRLLRSQRFVNDNQWELLVTNHMLRVIEEQ